jgi:serine/threonine protein kinase
MGFGMRNQVNHFELVGSHSIFDPSYQAPEMLSATDLPYEQTFSGDFWSLGVVLYQLLSGSLPFDDVDKFEKIDLI